ncbi:hypothetical protein ACWDSD_41670 [Streptomyces spiralis]
MLTSLPPCTEMTISQEHLIYPEKGVPLEGLNTFWMVGTGTFPVKGWDSLAHQQPLLLNGDVAFLDRNGVFWARKEGRLVQDPGPLTTLYGVPGQVTGLPTYSALNGCEDSGG